MEYEALRTIDLPRIDLFIESGSVFDESDVDGAVIDNLLPRGKIAPITVVANEPDALPEPEPESIDDEAVPLETKSSKK